MWNINSARLVASFYIISTSLFGQMPGETWTRTFDSQSEFETYEIRQLCDEWEFFKDSIAAAFELDPDNVSVDVGNSHYRSDNGGVMFWGGCYNKLCMGQNPFTKYTYETSCDKRDFSCYEDIILNVVPDAYSKFSKDWHYPKRIFDFAEDEINFDFVTDESGRTIAQAHSPLEGDTRIIINIDKWEELNHKERIWLILHEFGHEFFGMEHGSNKLMYPLMPSDDLKKLGSPLDRSYYKEGQIYPEYFLGGIENGGTSRKTGHADNILIDAIIDFCDYVADNYYAEPAMINNVGSDGTWYGTEDIMLHTSRKRK